MFYKSLYRLFILTLGMTSVVTLIYGLSLAPTNTISMDLKDYMPFRLILTVCLVLQTATFFLCFYCKETYHQEEVIWGYLTCIGVVVSWTGFTTFMEGKAHIIFVAFFMSFLVILMLIMYKITWQREALVILKFTVLFLILVSICMTAMVTTDNFYIIEYIGFIPFNLAFILFFIAHDSEEWGKPNPNSHTDCEASERLLVPMQYLGQRVVWQEC